MHAPAEATPWGAPRVRRAPPVKVLPPNPKPTHVPMPTPTAAPPCVCASPATSKGRPARRRRVRTRAASGYVRCSWSCLRATPRAAWAAKSARAGRRRLMVPSRARAACATLRARRDRGRPTSAGSRFGELGSRLHARVHMIFNSYLIKPERRVKVESCPVSAPARPTVGTVANIRPIKTERSRTEEAEPRIVLNHDGSEPHRPAERAP